MLFISLGLRIGELTIICLLFLSPKFGFAPKATLRVMPSDSRIESSGGFVTCANLCEKNFAIPPSSSANAFIALP